MGAYNVVITKQAQKHLKVIYDYIAIHLEALGLAKSLMAILFNEFESLAVEPEKHPLVNEEPWREYGIRRLLIKKYLVYFYIDKNSKTVGILGVIYQDKKDQDLLCPPNFTKKQFGFDPMIQFNNKERK